MSLSAGVQPKPKIDWPSVAQFALGSLAISGAWMLALSGVLGAWFDSLQASAGNTSTFSTFIVLAGVFIISLLLVPSTYHALRRILNLPPKPFSYFDNRFGLVVLLLPVLVYLIVLTQQNDLGGWAIVLHLLTALVTVGWLLWLAVRDLRPGSAQRSWGAFATGLTVTPVLAIIPEILGGLVLLSIFSVYANLNPQLSHLLQRLNNPLLNNPLDGFQLIGPFLNDPVVLLLALSAISLLAPIVEEILKPLGVFFLLGRELSDAQGFALGALCGAGYGLIENLTLSADLSSLAVTAIGRIGASSMHMLTAAMMGLALARAKRTHRVLPALGTLLINVFLHGTWNALVLFSAAGEVTAQSGVGLIPAIFQQAGPMLLGLLALSYMIFLMRLNRKMVKQEAGLLVNSP